jgi:carbamoyl-phosphate synthase small subunit
MTNEKQRALLIFEDGKTFRGSVFAKGKEVSGEVVFNTSMTGYQEVLTDPSYKGQIVLLTYPHIGNYGIIKKDDESHAIQIKALLVREYCDCPSNWEQTQSLKSYLEDANITGAEGFDTRAITRYIRKTGAKKAFLSTTRKTAFNLDCPPEKNVIKSVSIDLKKYYPLKTGSRFKVAVVDTGVKWNILRMLQKQGCEIVRFPFSVSSYEILKGGFDGVLLSNGPGDPEKALSMVKMVRHLLGKLPIFGICMGHQILGMATGAKIEKLKFGHHGSNHPIKNLENGQVEITAQNHNYVLIADSIKQSEVKITHMNLLDNSVAGIRHLKYPAFSVQYHPEACPGPNDSVYLFKQFSKLMKEHSMDCCYTHSDYCSYTF